jgi:hypothetical protein
MIKSLSIDGELNFTIADKTKIINKDIAETEIHAPEIVPYEYSLGTAW